MGRGSLISPNGIKSENAANYKYKLNPLSHHIRFKQEVNDQQKKLSGQQHFINPYIAYLLLFIFIIILNHREESLI